MDKAHVTEIATKQLQQIQAARQAAPNRSGSTRRDIFDRNFPRMATRLDEELMEYCRIYTEAPKRVANYRTLTTRW